MFYKTLTCNLFGLLLYAVAVIFPTYNFFPQSIYQILDKPLMKPSAKCVLTRATFHQTITSIHYVKFYHLS